MQWKLASRGILKCFDGQGLTSLLLSLHHHHHYNIGCLPFTRAKLGTSKFRSGIAIIISTNQFHLLKNIREGVKLLCKMAFCLEHHVP